MLNSGSTLIPETMGAAEVSRAGEGRLTAVGIRGSRQHHGGGRQSRTPRRPVPWALISARTALPHPAVPRLAEQTLLVEKLTEQNASKERAISSLRMDMQRLVRGWERAAGGGTWASLSSLSHPPSPQESQHGSRGPTAPGDSGAEVETPRLLLDSIT